MSKVNFYNKDGLELLKSLPDNSIDFVLTDPPYELDNHGGVVKGHDLERKLNKDKHINYISDGFDMNTFFNEYVRVCKKLNVAIFCSNKQVSKTMNWFEEKGYSTTLLIWQKPNPIPLGNGKYISDLEFIIYAREKGATFNNIGVKEQLKTFRYSAPSTSERIHPTEKPIDLLRRLLLIHTNENNIVLDTFAGSFTTALACFKENRQFIGSEIDTEMFNKAKKRFEWHKRQLKLF